MSCLDVMYHQTYGGHHCLPATSAAAAAYKVAYHHRQQQQKKISSFTKMQDSADLAAELARSKELKEACGEDRGGRGGAPAKEAAPAEAEYLSSRCVLFTYFQGDIGDVVDEHFSRALSQFSSLADDRKGNRTPSGGLWKDTTSLSAGQCAGFPSPLWSSGYPPQSSPCIPSLHSDFPPTSTFHSGEASVWAGHAFHQSGLPTQPSFSESWHYALGAQGGGGYPHVHEVYPHVHARHMHPHGHAHHVLHHGAALDPRFSPLFLSSVRPSCSPVPHCDGVKAEPETSSPPSWPGSFHGSVDIYDAALDQEKGKASVWF